MNSEQEIKQAVEEVSRIVSEISGIQLGVRQSGMVENRLRSRMLKIGVESFSDYLAYLKKNMNEESNALVSLMTTHHTYFFREFAHFEFLINKALNHFIQEARKRTDKKIRIWSAACSRGQEVYSLAMFFHFHLKLMAPDIDFEIIGSDVDQESVNFAQNGVYRIEELRQAPAMYIEGSWIRGEGEISEFSKIKKHLKSKCKFSFANLMDLDGFLKGQKFDLIFCRNVFIYFNSQQIKIISSKFIQHLNPIGFLMLGVSESLNGLGLPLELAGPSIYYHKESRSSVLGVSKAKNASSANAGTDSRGVIGAAAPFTLPVPQVVPEILNVLCVDDSSTIHALLAKILIPQEGFRIKAKAMNGKEALDILQKEKFDIITLDLHMPEVDGISFLKAYGGGKIPVVILSSVNRDDLSLAQQALGLGAKDYVEKPSLQNMEQAANEIRSKIRTIVQINNFKKAN